jgi:hypothetical protein
MEFSLLMSFGCLDGAIVVAFSNAFYFSIIVYSFEMPYFKIHFIFILLSCTQWSLYVMQDPTGVPLLSHISF